MTDSRRQGCYINPAPVLEIMMEQLRFLVEHASEDCAHDCAECARMAQIQSWLLRPFLPAKHPPSFRSVAA